MSLPPYPCLGVKPDGDCPQTPTYQARECTSGASWWGSQYQGRPWPTGWGNALNWPTRARDAGFQVDTVCTPNSIMCLPPNHNGAGPRGHVAYVVGAVVQSHAQVWEMNFLIPYGFDYRPALVTGCEYIHLVDPSPVTGAKKMTLINCGPTYGVYLLTGGGFVPVSEPADVQAWIQAGAVDATHKQAISQEMFVTMQKYFPPGS